MKVFIPESIDVNKIVEQNPPFKGFQEDKFIYILGLINKLSTRSRYARLDSRLLRKYVWNYNQYLRYALNLGIIESNGSYLAGKKAKGYRFTKFYRGGVKPASTEMGFKPTKKQEQALDAPEHLTQWLPGLRIDKDAALEHLESLRLAKKPRPKMEHYEAQRQIIYNIAQGCFKTWIDPNYNRFHHPITFMKREIRNFLTYKGLPLVEVDLANSQPYLASLLITDYRIIQKLIYQQFGKIEAFKRFGLQEDEIKFLKEVSFGAFYKTFKAEAGRYIEESLSISEFKQKVLKVFYRKNGFYDPYSEAFRNIYPNVFRRFKVVKRGNYKRLSYFLGRLESYLFVERISKRISREKPDLPFILVHDSLAVPKGHEDWVAKIINEELLGFIGIKPHLKMNIWQPEGFQEIKEAA